MVDDQPRHTASAQIMPKLNKYLRAGGTDFAHGYVSSPVCGPARAALFKGQYLHNTGVITNSTTHQEFKARGLDPIPSPHASRPQGTSAGTSAST